MKLLVDLLQKLRSAASPRRRTLRLTWHEIAGLLFGLTAARQLVSARRIPLRKLEMRAGNSDPTRNTLENARRRAVRLYKDQYGLAFYRQQEKRWNNHLRWIHAWILWPNCNRLGPYPAPYRRRLAGAAASVNLLRAELIRRNVELPHESQLIALAKRARHSLGWPAPVYLENYDRTPRRGRTALGGRQLPDLIIPTTNQLALDLADVAIEYLERDRRPRRVLPHEQLLNDRGDPVALFKAAIDAIMSAESIRERRKNEQKLLKQSRLSIRKLAGLVGLSEGTIRHDLKVLSLEEAKKKVCKKRAEPARRDSAPTVAADGQRSSGIEARGLSTLGEKEKEVSPNGTPSAAMAAAESSPAAQQEHRSPPVATPHDRTACVPSTTNHEPPAPSQTASDGAIAAEIESWIKKELREYPGVVSTAVRNLRGRSFRGRLKGPPPPIKEVIERCRRTLRRPPHWDDFAYQLANGMQDCIEAVSPDKATALRIANALLKPHGLRTS